jgi:hypothetical protein
VKARLVAKDRAVKLPDIPFIKLCIERRSMLAGYYLSGRTMEETQ